MAKKSKFDQSITSRQPIPFWSGWNSILSSFKAELEMKLENDAQSANASDSTITPSFLEPALKSILLNIIAEAGTLVHPHNSVQIQNSCFLKLDSQIKSFLKRIRDPKLFEKDPSFKVILALASILSESYFLSQDFFFRKSLLVLLSRLSTLFPSSLNLVLLFQLNLFLGTKDEKYSNTSQLAFLDQSKHIEWLDYMYSLQTPANKATILQNIFQIPLASSLLELFDLNIVNQFINIINDLIKNLTSCTFSYNSNTSASTEASSSRNYNLTTPNSSLEVSSILSTIYNLGKFILFAFSKSNNYFSKNSTASELQYPEAESSSYISQITSLKTIARMFLLLQLPQYSAEAKEIFSLIYVSCILNTGLYFEQENLLEYLSSQLSDVNNVLLDSKDILSILTFHRAVISKIETEFFVFNEIYFQQTSFLKLFFLHISEACKNSQLLPSVKVIAFDCLLMWVERVFKVISFAKQSLNENKSEYQLSISSPSNSTQSLSVKTSNPTPISDSSSFKSISAQDLSSLYNRFCDFLLDGNRNYFILIMWSYWDDPIEAVQHKVNDIFQFLIEISNYYSSENGPNKDIADSFINYITSQAISLDWAQKIKYSLLSKLINSLGSFSILKCDKDIIYTAISNMENPMMAPQIAQLLISFLSDTSFSKPNHDIISSYHAQEVCDFVDTWVQSIFRAYLLNNSVINKMIARHVLPHLFKSHPETLQLLLELIVIDLDSKSPATGPLKSDSLVQKYVSKASDISQTANLDSLSQKLRIETEDDIFLAYKNVVDNSLLADGILFNQSSVLSTQIYTVISILNVAKSIGLISPVTLDDGSLSYNTVMENAIYEILQRKISKIIKLALNHYDSNVKADVLGLLCSSFKLIDPIDEGEVRLVLAFLSNSSNSSSPEFCQRQTAILIAWAEKLLFVYLGLFKKLSKVLVDKTKYGRNSLSEFEKLNSYINTIKSAIRGWFETAINCIYPGATFIRVSTGMQWISLILKYFTPEVVNERFTKHQLPECDPSVLSDIIEVYKSNSVYPIISVLINDTFKKNRNAAFELLLKWPSADLSTNSDSKDKVDRYGNKTLSERDSSLVEQLLYISNNKILQPRANEIESGAHLLFFVFCKYVLNGNAVVFLSDFAINGVCDISVLQGSSICEIGMENFALFSSNSLPILIFFAQLLSLVKECLDELEKNLLDAALNKPISGLLILLNLVIEKINWMDVLNLNEAGQKLDLTSLWKSLIAFLYDSLIRASSLVSEILSNPSPEGNIPASFRDTEISISNITSSEIDDIDWVENDFDLSDSDIKTSTSPKHQILLSFCWRAIKEISSLQTTIICSIPCVDQNPLNSKSNSQNNASLTIDVRTSASSSWIIEPRLVKDVGENLFLLLTSIRHRGAFVAVYREFSRACRRVYKSYDSKVNYLIGAWIDKCLNYILSQQVSITRRSAGWPYCLLALLTCDRDCATNMLHPTICRLSEIASKEVALDKNENNNVDLPQVHAANMLRLLFDDKILASDMVPYIEESMLLSLNGLESNHWAIRNVCGLLFASLMRKIFGTKKTKKENDKINGYTAKSLFTRFPRLFEILFDKLNLASYKLDCFYSGLHQSSVRTGIFDSDILGFVNPSLYPCLVLLSRLQMQNHELLDPNAEKSFSLRILKNKTESTQKNTNFDEYSISSYFESLSMDNYTLSNFSKMILSCSRSPVIKTRIMAARAVVPTIPLVKAPTVLLEFLDRLVLLLSRKQSMSSANCGSELEKASISYNEVHGLISIVFELSNTLLENEALGHSIISIIEPLLDRLDKLIEIAIHDNLQNEIVRSSILRLISLFTGKTVFINLFKMSAENSPKKESIPLKLSTEPDSGDITKEKNKVLAFQARVWNKVCVQTLLQKVFTNKDNSTEIVETRKTAEVDSSCLVIGASDTVIELTKITLTLAGFYFVSPPHIKSNISDFELGSVLLELAKNSDYYEIHVILLDWLHSLLRVLLNESDFTNPSNLHHGSHFELCSDPIISSMALHTLSQFFFLYDTSYLELSDQLSKEYILKIWQYGVSYIGNPNHVLSVKNSFLVFLSSMYIVLKKYNSSIFSKTESSAYHDKLVSTILSWSNEDNEIGFRISACDSIFHLCLRNSPNGLNLDSTYTSTNLQPDLVLSIFNLLFDDDESIREKMAKITSRINPHLKLPKRFA
ncbi:hypothetical protein BB560_001014 [Smittium megazygosporum]|uniref:Uncharacterized protein n=1 Tax=Smittium megazygosporum TaxID=133381 RepID=A0A2T9ZIP8_9FUNG|nr:hypothetical protein BB560_001014 [Smittium megazygosporum]